MHHLNADELNFVYGGMNEPVALHFTETLTVMMCHVATTNTLMTLAGVSPIQSVPYSIFSSPFSVFVYYQSKNGVKKS